MTDRQARPFVLDVPQERLDWIARRVADAHVGYAPDDDEDWKYGTDAAYLHALRDHWRDRYDWQAAAARFNAIPQFVATIGEVPIHFYHVRATHGGEGGGYPIILTHGWPGSVLEFLEVIPLLTARGYDVVVPSLPGYGFSGRPRRPIAAADIADMWRVLMTDVLGYARFGAQGGDWGSPVTIQLANRHADVVGAIHLNLLFHRPQADATAEERAWQDDSTAFFASEGTYSLQQMHKPQTIGLALADSPIGFASWVIEKYRAWSDCGGDIERCFTKDQLITSIMTYLVSDNVQSSIWLYNTLTARRPIDGRIEVPLGFAEFRESRSPPPRAAVERKYNIVRWTRMPRGGHFAAWEQPALFAEEVATFFDTWR
jgi:pimeloyl-ACP methyl ester carboxylesterase